MTEDTVRHYCRHCRGKLEAPTANHRQAFDSKGCYRSFYRKRCLVCEDPIEQPKRGERLICRKSKCINAFRESSDAAAKVQNQSQKPPILLSQKRPSNPTEDGSSWPDQN